MTKIYDLFENLGNTEEYSKERVVSEILSNIVSDIYRRCPTQEQAIDVVREIIISLKGMLDEVEK